VKPHVCSECPKCFYTAHELTQHHPVHSDYKQFCCGLYGKDFKCKYTVKTHFKKCSVRFGCTDVWSSLTWSHSLYLCIVTAVEHLLHREVPVSCVDLICFLAGWRQRSPNQTVVFLSWVCTYVNCHLAWLFILFVLFWFLVMFSFVCFTSVQWLAVKIISEMSCNVLTETLNPRQFNPVDHLLTYLLVNKVSLHTLEGAAGDLRLLVTGCIRNDLKCFMTLLKMCRKGHYVNTVVDMLTYLWYCQHWSYTTQLNTVQYLLT